MAGLERFDVLGYLACVTKPCDVKQGFTLVNERNVRASDDDAAIGRAHLAFAA